MILEEPEITEECISLTIGELKKMAKECIRLFFLGKKNHRGEPISDQVLCSKKHVNMVLDTTVVEGIKKIYRAFNKSGLRRNQEEKVINTLDLCAKYWIPKDFAGGIMLMYFSLCEGVRI